MILIININTIPFHYYEFVKPIEDIVRKDGFSFTSVHYKQLTENHLLNADNIIIAGTSLKDNRYAQDIDAFQWLKTFQKPVLGICGGMQLIGKTFGESIQPGQEIGLQTIIYRKPFLGETGKKEIYALHNNYVKNSGFEVYASSNLCSQAMKHPDKPIYGVLFHPEARNKNMISYFIKQI